MNLWLSIFLTSLFIFGFTIGVDAKETTSESASYEESNRRYDHIKSNTDHSHIIPEMKEKFEVELDMPDLIKFTDDVSVGARVNKVMWRDTGYDNWWLENDEGWTFVAKTTIKFSLFDFSKKKVGNSTSTVANR